MTSITLCGVSDVDKYDFMIIDYQYKDRSISGICMRIVKRLDLGEINILDSITALTHFGNNQNVC